MSTSKKLIGLLKDAAPTVATLLGTAATGNPALGAMAGQVIRRMGTDLKDDPEAREADLYPVLENPSPEILAKLRDIDAQLKKDLDDNGVHLEQIAAADRANARSLAVSLKSVEIHAWLTVGALALWVYFMYEFFCIIADPAQAAAISTVAAAVIGRMLGTLDGILIQAYSFWFGTTRGSKDKHEDLVKALERR